VTALVENSKRTSQLHWN